jgi:hypothetical protein
MSWQSKIKREIRSAFGNQLEKVKVFDDRVVFYCPSSFAYKILPQIKKEVKEIDPSLIVTQVGGLGRSFNGVQVRTKSVVKESISQVLEGIPVSITCNATEYPSQAELIEDDGTIVCSNCWAPMFSLSDDDQTNEETKREFLFVHDVKGNINEQKEIEKHDILKKIRKPLPPQKHSIHKDKTKYDRKKDKKKIDINEAKQYAAEGFDVELTCLLSHKKDGYLIYDPNYGDSYFGPTSQEYKFNCSVCGMKTSDPQFDELHTFSNSLSLNESDEPVDDDCPRGYHKEYDHLGKSTGKCIKGETDSGDEVKAALRRYTTRISEVIRKVGNEYVLYSKKEDPKTGKRRVLGRSKTREGIEKRERQIQYFKNKG